MLFKFFNIIHAPSYVEREYIGIVINFLLLWGSSFDKSPSFLKSSFRVWAAPPADRQMKLGELSKFQFNNHLKSVQVLILNLKNSNFLYFFGFNILMAKYINPEKYKNLYFT